MLRNLIQTCACVLIRIALGLLLAISTNASPVSCTIARPKTSFFRERKISEWKKKKTGNRITSYTFYLGHSMCNFFFLVFVLFSYAICSHFEEFGMFKLNKLLLFHVEFHTGEIVVDCRKTNFQMIRMPEQRSAAHFVIFHLLEILEIKIEKKRKWEWKQSVQYEDFHLVISHYRIALAHTHAYTLHVWCWTVSSYIALPNTELHLKKSDYKLKKQNRCIRNAMNEFMVKQSKRSAEWFTKNREATGTGEFIQPF